MCHKQTCKNVQNVFRAYFTARFADKVSFPFDHSLLHRLPVLFCPTSWGVVTFVVFLQVVPVREATPTLTARVGLHVTASVYLDSKLLCFLHFMLTFLIFNVDVICNSSYRYLYFKLFYRKIRVLHRDVKKSFIDCKSNIVHKHDFVNEVIQIMQKR